MPQTKEGAKKARDKMLRLYGPDFYARIGKEGGIKSKRGGFASTNIGKDGLTGKERARIAGAKGGATSRRGKAKQQSV